MSKTALTIDAAQHRSNLGVRVIRGVKNVVGVRGGAARWNSWLRPVRASEGFGVGMGERVPVRVGRSGAGGQTTRA